MESNHDIDILENDIYTMDNDILDILLLDRTTGRNIIWASDDYESYGESYEAKYPITVFQITKENKDIIQPRVTKNKKEQLSRTKGKAEVFTPSWICNLQNNLIDSQWFGRENVLNTVDNCTWKSTQEYIKFPEGKMHSWQKYVDERRLEITCGEAPYLVSRYDTVTGSPISLPERIGLLDRKMRIINENVNDEKEWIKWTKRAFESVYGFEYQGDSLLLARENLLYTFVDNLWWKFQRKATPKELKEIATIISWNIWQMDGVSYTVPFKGIYEQYQQLSMNDSFNENNEKPCYCKIKDWRSKKIIFCYKQDVSEITLLSGVKKEGDIMKINAVVGNPPYHEIISKAKGNKSLGKNLFPHFTRCAMELSSEYVSLIIPSKWFAGKGQDGSFVPLRQYAYENNHFHTIKHYSNNDNIFDGAAPGAVNYFLFDKKYSGETLFYNNDGEPMMRPLFEEGIDIIMPLNSMVSIIKKITSHEDFTSLTTITNGRNAFGITGKNEPNISSETYFDGAYELRCAHEKIKYIKKEHIEKNFEIADSWKIFTSKGNGAAGTLGDEKQVSILGKPYVAKPYSVCTDSLFPIGCYETEIEAINLSLYLKTKFVRYAAGIMKMTQNITQIVYKYVPLQNFTNDSDIDWSKSIEEIDKQLYQKYGLNENEIELIETKIKPMD